LCSYPGKEVGKAYRERKGNLEGLLILVRMSHITIDLARMSAEKEKRKRKTQKNKGKKRRVCRGGYSGKD